MNYQQKKLRMTLRNLELGFQPLLNLISQIIIEGSTSNFENQIENFCYQFVIQIVDHLFNGNDSPFEMQFNQEADFKMASFLYIQKIKQFIQANYSKNKAIQQIQSIINEIKQSLNTEPEGFSQSSKSSESNSSLDEQKSKISSEESEYHWKKIIDQKDLAIEKLQQKVAIGQEQMSKITTSYLKDIQNLRDQILRGANSSHNSGDDNYNVKYLEASDISDPAQLQILNNKIDEIKLKYEIKTKDYQQQIEKLKCEIKNRDCTISQQKKNLENPDYLIRRAFSFIENPYRFWKILQDFKGNQYWFEVFEVQRPSFGINYREVNQLLMGSKAYEREFQYYKSALDNSLLDYYEQASRNVNQLKDELKKKDEELDLLKQNFENERNIAITAMRKQFDQLLNAQKDLCRILYYLNQLYNQNINKNSITYQHSQLSLIDLKFNIL